jgi:4-diphosphocytidyl-2-C-methyl-D-erythritol kinase
MDCVTVHAPAKLNLTLDITGVLPNGYHTVDMMMQAVGLYERVVVRKCSGLWLDMPGSRVPVNPQNTAIKAALAFFEATGLLAGAGITVYKSVPVRAGMAGGSADAAAVLVALNALYGARLSTQELCEIGVKIGADVPFSLLGGTARVTGIGEILTPVAPCPPCWFTVCMPVGGGVSTPRAYARYDQVGTNRRPDNDAAQAALAAGNLADLSKQMVNALEFSSRSRANRPIETILSSNGARAALMTGSGAAVFGVFDTRRSACRASQALARRGFSNTWVVPPVPHGAHVVWPNAPQ